MSVETQLDADEIGQRALYWWERTISPAKGDAGTRARLRRCRSSMDALLIPAVWSLMADLHAIPAGPNRLERNSERAVGLARVLAHIKDPSGRRPMQAAGWRFFPGQKKESDAGSDGPVLSELRFRRLLATPRGDGQVAAFARLVALLDGSVNLPALAKDFWYWNDSTRTRWAYDYFAAATAAPETSTMNAEIDG